MMQYLEVPVYDEGLGEYMVRRVAVIGCLAHVGDVNQPAQFRLYLAQVAKDGSLIPMGADSISTDYLEGFIDQAQRLYDVLIAGGERNWAGNKIDFGRAAEAIGQKAGKAAVSAIVEAARALREQIPEQERDPEGALERSEYEDLVRRQQELTEQLQAKAKLLEELG